MTSILKLYRHITPNVETFTYFETTTQYENSINNYHAKDLTLDNYRINGDTIKITDLQDAGYDINYFIEKITDNNNNVIYWRCYNVVSVIYQSGYAIYKVSVDLWATYLHKANLRNFYVNRCNRLIDTPIFDNIKASTGNEIQLSVDSNNEYNGIATADYLNIYRYISHYSLILIVNYNAKQNITGTNIASTTSVFAIGLDAIRNKYIDNIPNEPQRSDYETEEEYLTAYNAWYANLTDEQKELYFNLSAVEMARDFAGGIFGITASNFSKNDAHVISAYIIDNQFISTSGWEVEYSSFSILRHSELKLHASLLVGTDKPAKSLYVRSLTLNRKVYAGLNHGGLLLNRVINEDYAILNIRVIIGASSVEVVLLQGDNQADITSAYELTITNNVTQTTMLRQIATAIGKTGSTTKAITKGYEEAGAMGAIGGALTSFASLVGDFKLLSEVRGSGDALNTYGGYGQYVKIPYIATAFESIDDEERHARLFGATFSKHIDLVQIFDYQLMGSGGLSQQSTYVRATCNVTSIPIEAKEYIQRKLAEGIYINKAS